jgi:hypothetical protein
MNGVGPLKSLPVQTHPRFAATICIERLTACLVRAERALRPPVWRKILGGVSRDHARAVAASCKADSRKIRMAIRDLIQALATRAMELNERNSALKGYFERLLALLDEWRDWLRRFEENEFQADGHLLAVTRNMLTLCSTIKEGSLRSDRMAA